MSMFASVKRNISFLMDSKRTLDMISDIDADSPNLLTDDIENIVDRFADNLAFITEQERWTYREFESYANRVAHLALAKGLGRGDSVAIFSQNRLQYVALWFGLSKVGVQPALLNYQLSGKALAHCVNIAASKFAIVDYDLREAWASAEPSFDHTIQVLTAFGPRTGAFAKRSTLQKQLMQQPDTRPDRSLREGLTAKDELMKMFTSGTTGLPKAAKIAHTKAQYYMRGFVIASGATEHDRMLMVLPMYHATGGLCGVGAVMMRGGAVIVQDKFSVSSFWDEARTFEATHFMYVGELCRFLLNAPPKPNDQDHSIRCIVGNGLRPEVWTPFVERFGIDKVVEFYGATEGNVTLVNFDGTVGAVGRVPWYFKSKFNGDIVRYDVESDQHIRGDDGYLITTEPGEIGELIAEVRPDETRFRYDGYQNRQESEKKILRNVFKQGDVWFRTGDLFWRDKKGYYYFADRIGDTYRWKAENVSTNEVAGVISTCKGVEQANVYGVAVPGYGGKAGMASLVVGPDFDLAVLHDLIETSLPSYACPVFIRLGETGETTTTFKYKKTDLVDQGYDPAKVADPLYVNVPGTGAYESLDPDVFAKIENREIKF